MTMMMVYDAQYLSRKVIAELELLEESRHEDCRKEENHTPEENIRDVGSMRATGAAHKLSLLFNTVLQQQEEGRVKELKQTQTHSRINITPTYSSTESKAFFGGEERLFLFKSWIESKIIFSFLTLAFIFCDTVLRFSTFILFIALPGFTLLFYLFYFLRCIQIN